MDNNEVNLSRSEIYSLMFDLSKSGINLDKEIALMGQSDSVPKEVANKLDKILTQQLEFVQIIKSKWIYKVLLAYKDNPESVDDGLLVKCLSSVLTHLAVDFDNENYLIQSFNSVIPLHELTETIYASLMKADNYKVALYNEVKKLTDYLQDNG